jgi:hypothetical protein
MRDGFMVYVLLAKTLLNPQITGLFFTLTAFIFSALPPGSLPLYCIYKMLPAATKN